MQDRLELPSLYDPANRSRIQSLNEYREWEEGRKEAYRKELDREVEERQRSRQRRKEQKNEERMNLSLLVDEERSKQVGLKYAKIKTEQKYRDDNLKLMKSSKRRSTEARQAEDPFSVLVQEEQLRKRQTRTNFILQNRLNHIQTQLNNSSRRQRKEKSAAEGRHYVQFVQAEFDKQLRQRIKFQQKYLQIDPPKPKQHLPSHHAQVRYTQVHHHKTDQSPQRPKWQNEGRNGQDFRPRGEEVLRSGRECEEGGSGSRAKSSLTSSSNVIRFQGAREGRQFRGYDIIGNSERVFVS